MSRRNFRRVLAVACLLGHAMVAVPVGWETAHARSHKLAALGLSRPKVAKLFAKQFKKELPEWPHRTLDQRAQSLARVANHVLRKLGVPPVQVEHDRLPGNQSQFDSQNWVIYFDDALLSHDTLDEITIFEVAKATYHEACHAEEQFLIARWRAASAIRVGEVQRHVRIPIRVVARAFRRPLQRERQEVEEVRRWDDALYGDQHESHRATIRRTYETAEVYEAAKKDVDRTRRNPEATRQERMEARQRLRQAWQEQDDAYRAYQKLPDEEAAFSAGEVLRSIWQEVK